MIRKIKQHEWELVDGKSKIISFLDSKYFQWQFYLMPEQKLREKG